MSGSTRRSSVLASAHLKLSIETSESRNRKLSAKLEAFALVEWQNCLNNELEIRLRMNN